MVFCPNCGKEIDENDQFCKGCGSKIKPDGDLDLEHSKDSKTSAADSDNKAESVDLDSAAPFFHFIIRFERMHGLLWTVPPDIRWPPSSVPYRTGIPPLHHRYISCRRKADIFPEHPEEKGLASRHLLPP